MKDWGGTGLSDVPISNVSFPQMIAFLVHYSRTGKHCTVNSRLTKTIPSMFQEQDFNLASLVVMALFGLIIVVKGDEVLLVGHTLPFGRIF